ncbi:MAG: NAD-dependent epimerase/dehydratase family protein [Candidatus Lokiarchaeota archaeon]|nr:NAD-dependent epimerase/dehydratase family protein [Candidatus Lokiarchaeota archaeon]
MNVLMTGAEGYIGTVLASLLIESGHTVTGIDTGFYRNGWLYNGIRYLPAIINKDTRQIEIKDLKGFDAIVHLADLSNDPIGQLNPEVTYRINRDGSIHLAELSKKAGVQRYVYSSSCSVYGTGNEDWKTEESEVNPQTVYAECKAMVEQHLKILADENFSPVFLRNATAYGASPRMRFDLVLNNLSGLAWTIKEINMTSDGSPWRPLVHVRDIARAMKFVLEAPKQNIHNQIFNVGDNNENYQVRDVAKIVSETFPGCSLSIGKSDSDNRSYRVRFDKINKIGYKTSVTLREGAQQLHDIFTRIDMTDEMFKFNPYTRLKQIQYLIRVKEIDEELFWRF